MASKLLPYMLINLKFMKYANHYLLASILLVFFLGPVAFDYGLLSLVNLEILFLSHPNCSVFSFITHDTKLFKITVVSLITYFD